MHTLISGGTESGKTTLAKLLAKKLRTVEKPVVVCDILGSSWDCNVMFTDPEEFLEYIQTVQSCYIFIDEAGEVNSLHKELSWLATRSRHYGHSVFFISQRVMALKPIVRSQCSILHTFNMNFNDSKILSLDFNHPELIGATTLQQGHFLSCSRFGRVERKVLFNGRKQC